jgi:hypothetical protein
MRIAFTTRNTIGKLLTCQTEHQIDKYTESGVYQMKCLDCQKNYIGQTGRSFHTRYKEHAQDYRHDNHRSNLAKRPLEHQHTLHPIEDSMEVLYTSKKKRPNAQHHGKILHLR